MWWKKNKWKIIIPVFLTLIISFAFWYGGNAPNSRGWNPNDAKVTVETHKSKAKKTDTDYQNATVSKENHDDTEGNHEQIEFTKPERSQEHPIQTEAPMNEEDKVSYTNEVPTVTQKPTMQINSDTGLDRFQTEPVPNGNPIPIEPQDVSISSNAHTCTFSISCATILSNMDLLDPEKKEQVPKTGWILEPTTVTFYEGESVFNVLQRICKQYKIHMEFENTPIYNSAYIEGINNLYEFGWGIIGLDV